MIETIKEKVLNGDAVSREEVFLLAKERDKQALFHAAGEIRDRRAGRHFDTCSIINARSGRCSENCNGVPSRLFSVHI